LNPATAYLKEVDFMLEALQVLTVLLVSVAMALALAHALELPGKMRLPRESYLIVQAIYYPGFTIGGVGELAALVASPVLVIMTPYGTPAFWLVLSGFIALIGMHAVYWVVTHPVNKFWLKETKLEGAGAKFFSADPMRRGDNEKSPPGWTALRDRWEYSHVARAALALLSLTLIVTAVAI
jgi:hypothetical protein